MHAFNQTCHSLGFRMWSAGIDDGETGVKIEELQERLRYARKADLPLYGMESLLSELFVRLGLAALDEDAPLPGADEEYAAALKWKTAIIHQETSSDGWRLGQLAPNLELAEV